MPGPRSPAHPLRRSKSDPKHYLSSILTDDLRDGRRFVDSYH